MSLFLGDGIITPAISVLAAVEGVQVAAPEIQTLVLPLAAGILIALFAVQRFGTGAVSKLFGPIMVTWFGTLALAGLAQLVAHPAILAAVSPTYALAVIAEHPGSAFVSLGAVVLAVTGAEALYADRDRADARAGALQVPAAGMRSHGDGGQRSRAARAV